MSVIAVPRIVGLGSYLPERILSNDDLARMVDTTDEWIVSRTGMKERHIARDDEYPSHMGAAASRRALDDAGIAAKDIDLILLATITGNFLCPATAGLVQAELGAVNAAACDLGAACSGHLYGLAMAKAFIESGVYKNILVLSSEKMSSLVDYTGRCTCILFGDGAAAAVVSSEGPGYIIDSICLGSDGSKALLGYVPAGGSQQPLTKDLLDEGQQYFRMEGKEVFKHAVRKMESAAKECIKKAGLELSDISWVVPHQANQRIIEAMAKRFDTTHAKIYDEVHRYGNTSAAAVAIAMNDLVKEETIEVGEHLLLVVFGVGLTWGAAVVTKTE